ncbi:sugar isomerase domain-containing protein [Halobacillus kuroshimensis]|uniref:sugar isomerase domain-containing protein n=1 Tax=Halobacillus kuroshimensis TaxID=302481 RepID=UPI00040726D8|nr:SIS domain-containing protein [Halobacillus kuroshimensis]
MSYLMDVTRRLQALAGSQSEAFEVISRRYAEVISRGGVIHMFGCGHSSLIAQEAYYRAGGLVPVRPIMIEPLMLHQGAAMASRNERTPGFVHPYLEKEDVKPEDAVLVISTSGRNPAPVEAAEFFKEMGVYTTALTSLRYADSQPSRMDSGKRLEDVAENVIDMEVPVGDAVMKGKGTDYSPVSTVLGTAIIHELLTRTIQHLERSGNEVPIFKSGNVDGSDEHNQRMMEHYTRIRF